MPYNYLTIGDATDLVAAILTDAQAGSYPGKVRFVDDEIQLYIYEAMRTFSGLTGMWEDQTEPETIAIGTAFVDLPTTFPAMRAYTITDQDLIGIMCYHLWERKSSSSWLGTERFTLDDFTQALQRRRDQFLLETACRLTRIQTPIAPLDITGPDYSLDQTVMDLRRVAWVQPNGKVTPLWEDSRFSFQAASTGWNLQPGIPRTYRQSERSPMMIEFNPPPIDSGRLDLLATVAGDTLDPTTGDGVLLGIPDDLTWAIKWGALADLLAKDGPARDYARSLFCERRYRMGVAAALSVKPVSDVRVNGMTVQVDTIDHLDMGVPLWQAKTGTPTIAAIAGYNMLAISAPPKRSSSLEVTLIGNCPVVINGYLQIGHEYLDVILNYAAHLAMFKVGGQEFAATTHLAEASFLAAADYNETLKQSSVWEDVAYSDRKVASQKDRGIRRVTGGSVSQDSGSTGIGS